MNNLPPGVSVNDIPGNRPEDEWMELFIENVAVPDELNMAVDPEKLANITSQFLAAFGVVWTTAFASGVEEEKMAQMEREHERAFGADV